jgi:hypothetical protein
LTYSHFTLRKNFVMDNPPESLVLDEKKLNDQLSSFSDSYIKFLFYHLIIIFTIVYSLLNAVNSRNGDEVREIAEEVRIEAKNYKVFPEYVIDDRQIKELYFDQLRIDSSIEFITSWKRQTVSSEQAVKLKKLEEKLKTVKDIIDKTYKIKLSFLGDVFVDLRSWIYFLPVIFLISCIHIFICDYKIKMLKKYALSHMFLLDFNCRYPFTFLRGIFLCFEVALVATYTFLLFQYFEPSQGNIKTFTICTYFSLIYYGAVYCLMVSKEISYYINGSVEPSSVIRYLRKVKTLISTVFAKWNTRYIFGTGKLLLLSTLFLPMSCGQNTTKGLELLTTKSLWLHGIPDAYIYKYLYILSFIAGMLTVFFSGKFKLRYRCELNLITSYGVVVPLVFFTTYFSFYFIAVTLSDIDLDFSENSHIYITGVIFWMLWVALFPKRARADVWNLDDLFTFIIFLLPLVFFSVTGCIIVINDMKLFGWLPFYCSLWLLLLAIVLKNGRQN